MSFVALGIVETVTSTRKRSVILRIVGAGKVQLGQRVSETTGSVETAIRTMSRWGRDEVGLTEEDGFVVPFPEELRRLQV